MPVFFYIGHFIGICAAILSFFTYIQKTRKKVVLIKLSCDCLWCLHYFLIGAYSGGAINIVNISRDTVVYYREDKAWAKSKLWLAAFLIFTFISGMLSWQGYISLMPMIGSFFGVLGIYQSEPRKISLVTLPGIILWLIYSIFVFSPQSIICNIISITSVAIALFRPKKE